MEEKIVLDVVNKNAAGIDIGSRSHWVAVGQTDAEIKEFGVYNENTGFLCIEQDTWC